MESKRRTCPLEALSKLRTECQPNAGLGTLGSYNPQRENYEAYADGAQRVNYLT